MPDDLAYFAERAIEERRCAMASPDPRAREVHLDLAARYARLAGATSDEPRFALQESLDRPEQKAG